MEDNTWAVEDSLDGTKCGEGMTEEVARRRARELTAKCGRKFVAVDYAAEALEATEG